MRIRLFGALSICVVLSATGRPVAQSRSRMTLVTAGRLLDPRTGNVLAPAAVLIDGETIKQVGAPSEVQGNAAPDATLIDLGSATLLPGLIDGHTHLLRSRPVDTRT
jgi:imidazolonepropionase-like amidohydrolase